MNNNNNNIDADGDVEMNQMQERISDPNVPMLIEFSDAARSDSIVGSLEVDSVIAPNAGSPHIQNELFPPGGRRGGGGGPSGDDDNDPFKNCSLSDVGGLDGHIEYLRNHILEPLKSNNHVATAWGIKLPKGVMFYGPPGTGKTMLARAFGNELSKELNSRVFFTHRKGGDLLSKYVGGSTQLIKQMFQEARRKKPSIIFLDELDGLCPSRDGGSFMSQANVSIVTTLLGEMDDLPVGDVFVFGATNRLETVDAAMRRPGRFDKELEFFPPNFDARKQIIHTNTKKWKKCFPSANLLDELAHNTSSYTGADLEKLCRDTFFAAFNRHVTIANAHINDLTILDEDWRMALSKSKPTNMNIFGSSLFIPKAPPACIQPLLENIQKEIVEKLIPFLPKNSGASDCGISSIAPSTFLIEENDTQLNMSLDSHVMPAVFTDPRISSIIIYKLSKEGIFKNYGSKQQSYVEDLFGQAMNSFKPCILYIEEICEILADAPGVGQLLPGFIDKLSGKPVLVLVTGSGYRDNKSVPHFSAYQDISRSIGLDSRRKLTLRSNTEEERRKFFSIIFQHAAKYVNGSEQLAKSPKNLEGELNSLFETCLRETNGHSIRDIIRLHDVLLRTCSFHFQTNDKTLLFRDLKANLGRYAINKYKI